MGTERHLLVSTRLGWLAWSALCLQAERSDIDCAPCDFCVGFPCRLEAAVHLVPAQTPLQRAIMAVGRLPRESSWLLDEVVEETTRAKRRKREAVEREVPRMECQPPRRSKKVVNGAGLRGLIVAL